MKNKSVIKGFDTLRAFSILLVIITHLGFHDYFIGNTFRKDRLWPLISGLTGVQIFFSLSGFLITHLLVKEKLGIGRIDFKKFYVRRFLRLLPPLLVFYFIYLVSVYWNYIPLNIHGLIFSFFYVYNFIPNSFYSGELGHMWSLAVEEQYYIIWPFIIGLISCFKKGLYIIGLLLLVSIAAVYLLPQVSFNWHNKSYLLDDTFQLERWFIPAIVPVMIGSAAGILVNYRYNQLELILRNKFIWLSIAVLFYLCPLYLPIIMLPIKFVFQSLGIVILLLLIFYNQESNAVRIIHKQPFIYIGKISYGIYIYQGFFLMTGPGSQLKFQQFPLNIILTIVIAVISYEFIERKILKFKKKYQPSIQ